MIHTGDCVDVMAAMDADSVDAVVTDPPYGLEFMGKEWDRLDWRDGGGFSKPGIGDRPTEWTSFGGETANPTCATCGGRRRGAKKCVCAEPEWRVKGLPMTNRAAERNRIMQEWHTRWATEAYRVLKPGGHLLAFGGTRTYHRLASAIEDAGFEIRDCLVWAYASGFPKSLDVSKAIDKAAGAERELTRAGTVQRGGLGEDWDVNSSQERPRYDVPATDAAKRWQGWGTALKPAWEPIVMARKPLRGTVAGNVQQYGTGALNIDGTRIAAVPGDKAVFPAGAESPDGVIITGLHSSPRNGDSTPLGRWPPNLLLTDPLFDGGVDGVVGGGVATSGKMMPTVPDSARMVFGQDAAAGYETMETYGDTGTYSRFFLIPKAARSDREPVLRGQLAERDHHDFDPGGTMERWPDGHLEPRKTPIPQRENLHPTVKPVELMRHLVRLVTPPGGTVLDCFLGSGSTAIAAELEGFAWIGIEKEPEYVAIAEARLNGTQRGFSW